MASKHAVKVFYLLKQDSHAVCLLGMVPGQYNCLGKVLIGWGQSHANCKIFLQFYDTDNNILVSGNIPGSCLIYYIGPYAAPNYNSFKTVFHIIWFKAEGIYCLDFPWETIEKCWSNGYLLIENTDSADAGTFALKIMNEQLVLNEKQILIEQWNL